MMARLNPTALILSRAAWLVAAFAIGALSLSIPARAADINEEIKRFDYEIEWRTMKAVEELLTPRDYAAQIKFRFPVYPPKRSPQDINALVRAEVEGVVEEKYPQSHFDEIDQEAQRNFVLYKVGDLVTVKARIRQDEFKEVTGVIRMITIDHIKIGDLLISLQDVADKDLAHFDRLRREDAIKSYVTRNKRQYREARDEFETEQRQRITNAMYEQNGYIFRRGQWWPARMLFEAAYKNAVGKLMAEKRPEIRRQVLEMNGIVLDEAGNPVVPAGSTGTETAVTPKTRMEQASGILRDIVRKMYGGAAPAPTPTTAPDTEDGTGVFDDVKPADTPKSAPPEAAAPAPAKAPPADVSDLYDERD